MVDGRFPELQALILQIAAENRPWGEKMNPSRARKIGILGFLPGASPSTRGPDVIEDHPRDGESSWNGGAAARTCGVSRLRLGGVAQPQPSS